MFDAKPVTDMHLFSWDHFICNSLFKTQMSGVLDFEGVCSDAFSSGCVGYFSVVSMEFKETDSTTTKGAKQCAAATKPILDI